jgi:glycosyltransferase involved in cell wall biosynthesis
MVRVRNEARFVGRALRSILGVFDEIVVVDNASDDDTAAVVRDVQKQTGPGHGMRLLSYPHRLARFGREHGETPADSIHSAVYFTNWALSNCRFRCVCKWDGDMVLRREARDGLTALLADARSSRTKCWSLRGQTVFESTGGDFWLDPTEINEEIEVFPNARSFRFVGHPLWEQLRRPFYATRGVLEPVCFLELKYVGSDEFSHWSTTEWTTDRKKLEWENFHRVREGRTGDRLQRRPPSFLDLEAAG